MASRPSVECHEFLAELPAGIQEMEPSTDSSNVSEVSSTSSGRRFRGFMVRALMAARQPPGTDLNDTMDPPRQEHGRLASIVESFFTDRRRRRHHPIPIVSSRTPTDAGDEGAPLEPDFASDSHFHSPAITEASRRVLKKQKQQQTPTTQQNQQHHTVSN
eukprot:TRINITY_DN13425_c0_g1_i2.p2 TRINITY_DN13425_c0_g1~~TRINITY_DN13425_c0_g1_i2.p2  ORF type:complete len:160 (+),score=32.68 TRINITY_DN13425_c0_g1_i2:63-542(+)